MGTLLSLRMASMSLSKLFITALHLHKESCCLASTDLQPRQPPCGFQTEHRLKDVLKICESERKAGFGTVLHLKLSKPFFHNCKNGNNAFSPPFHKFAH